MLPMNLQPYTTKQKILHGLSMLIIIWLLVSGFCLGLVDSAATYKHFFSQLNVSLSLLLILLFIPRLFISFGRGFPAVKKSRQIMPWLVFITHTTIYLMVVIVLVTGILMMNGPIIFFNTISFPQPLHDPAWIERFVLLHTQACSVLALLVTMHVGAAIKHQLAGRAILQRMFT